MRVGINAAVTRERIRNAGTRINMHVDIDEAGRYIESLRIDDFLAVSRRECPSGHFAIFFAAIATSMIPLMLFFGSITCPFFRMRSYGWLKRVVETRSGKQKVRCISRPVYSFRNPVVS